MRIAILTDIHEDFQKLERAHVMLLNQGYDFMVCLGDTTGYAPGFYHHAPDANACIDFLRENAQVVLAGNHDLHTAQNLPSYYKRLEMPLHWYSLSLEERKRISQNRLWLYEEEALPVLSTTNTTFLQTLKEWYVLDTSHRRILFSHFLAPDLAGMCQWFPFHVDELREHFLFMQQHNCTLSFAGHSHPNGIALASRRFWMQSGFGKRKIKTNPRIVFVPSVVGGLKSSGCLIFDTCTHELIPLYLD